MNKAALGLHGQGQHAEEGAGRSTVAREGKLTLTWLEETLPALKRSLTSDAWLGVG